MSTPTPQGVMLRPGWSGGWGPGKSVTQQLPSERVWSSWGSQTSTGLPGGGQGPQGSAGWVLMRGELVALAQPRQPPGACETPRALRELGNVAFQEEEWQRPKESVLFGTMSVWAHKKREFLVAVYANTEWSVKTMQGEKHEAALLLEEKEKETKGVGELNRTSLFPKRWGNKEQKGQEDRLTLILIL